MIRRWYEAGRCGIPAAAPPGQSNHETGLAFDTPDESAWQGILSNHGFRWFGSQEEVPCLRDLACGARVAAGAAP